MKMNQNAWLEFFILWNKLCLYLVFVNGAILFFIRLVRIKKTFNPIVESPLDCKFYLNVFVFSIQLIKLSTTVSIN